METLEVMLAPMAKAASDPLGSMGNDAPLAHMRWVTPPPPTPHPPLTPTPTPTQPPTTQFQPHSHPNPAMQVFALLTFPLKNQQPPCHSCTVCPAPRNACSLLSGVGRGACSPLHWHY